MQEQDNLFFEEYKRLDRLCADMYGSQTGVKDYLSDMESQASMGRYYIPSWEADYKMLKHVHWVRNQIAHNPGTYEFSEALDSRFVNEFYSRILSGEDPLTQLRKKTKVQQKPEKEKLSLPHHEWETLYRPQPPVFVQPPIRQKKKGSAFAFILIALGLALLIYTLYLKFLT